MSSHDLRCNAQEVQEKSSSQGSSSQRSKGPSFRADPKVIKRLHRLEKHMRENKLRHTFADQLGEAQESDELNSKKEARKLAFYLFWNVRPDYDRCRNTLPLTHSFPFYMGSALAFLPPVSPVSPVTAATPYMCAYNVYLCACVTPALPYVRGQQVTIWQV